MPSGRDGPPIGKLSLRARSKKAGVASGDHSNFPLASLLLGILRSDQRQYRNHAPVRVFGGIEP